MLAQSSFHANNLTENEYVTAKTAQDCCVIALDWLVMLAKEDTTDQSSIPALSRHRQKFQDSWQNRNRGTWSQGFFEKNSFHFISFFEMKNSSFPEQNGSACYDINITHARG